MAVRICPLCMTKLSPAEVAFSDALECPGCHAPLEVSRASHILASTLGLLAGALIWRLTRDAGGMLGWVLPVVYAFLAYSVVSALILMLVADLRIRPAAAPQVVEHPTVAHGAGARH